MMVQVLATLGDPNRFSDSGFGEDQMLQALGESASEWESPAQCSHLCLALFPHCPAFQISKKNQTLKSTRCFLKLINPLYEYMTTNNREADGRQQNTTDIKCQSFQAFCRRQSRARWQQVSEWRLRCSSSTRDPVSCYHKRWATERLQTSGPCPQVVTCSDFLPSAWSAPAAVALRGVDQWTAGCPFFQVN